MSNKPTVFYEATPNPSSLKFNFGRALATESLFFESASQAIRSPLAKKIFAFPWTQAIFVGPDFITITKQDWVEWSVIADPLSDLIAEHIENGDPIIIAQEQSTPAYDENDSEDVKVIKTILNNEIRPAVAMDGGDIMFNRFEDDVLYIQMQGSCNGCPSSTMTLKMGIESRLKEALPKIKEVIAI